MEAIRKQTNCKFRRGKIHTPKGIPWCVAFKEIGSEEFRYVFDLITGGRSPGKAVQHEDINSNR
ncbi:MAG TPA: hypothetical protein DEA91_22255 [Paenibacillus sp.]|nr:hypothetical protein [Paenibacillus sp.]